MSLIFENYKLLELFDDYKIIDEEIEAVKYYIHYKENLTLSLYISPYDGYASLTLTNNTPQTMLFGIGINDLEEIECKENKIFFYKEGKKDEPFLVAQIKPSISLSTLSV